MGGVRQGMAYGDFPLQESARTWFTRILSTLAFVFLCFFFEHFLGFRFKNVALKNPSPLVVARQIWANKFLRICRSETWQRLGQKTQSFFPDIYV